jgi:hypothetical protein
MEKTCAIVRMNERKKERKKGEGHFHSHDDQHGDIYPPEQKEKRTYTDV